MTLTLEISPEVEKQLRHAAARAGVAPDVYVVGLLQQNLQQTPMHGQNAKSLPRQEANLLNKINRSLSQSQWERYGQLIAKRQAETLTPSEQKELVSISDQLETDNVQRIKYLAQLARLRNTSVSKLMIELGIGPRSHA